jgi:hypothetical protein
LRLINYLLKLTSTAYYDNYAIATKLKWLLSLLFTVDVKMVVVSIGEVTAKLTLNRRLLTCWRAPEKSALFIAPLMSVLGIETLETINPGDVAVPD